MKTRTIVISLLVLAMFILVFRLIPNITKIAFNPANQNIPKKTSSSFSYRKHLDSAKVCIKINAFNLMETHLIKAEWAAKEKGKNISKKVKDIYLLGARASIEEALKDAIYSHMNYAKYELARYQRYCSNAGIQPDKEKIAEVEKIIQRN